MESQPNTKKEGKRSANLWCTLSNIVDRILLVAVTIIYIVMFISLLPEKFWDYSQDVYSVEIIGY